MDPTQAFPFVFPGLNLNYAGLPNDEAQQRGILTADPLPDFSQLFLQYGGAPNFGSFALNSSGNSTMSDGTDSDSGKGFMTPNDGLPSAATVPDLSAFLAQYQGSLPALLAPQSTAIVHNQLENYLDPNQNQADDNQKLDFSSNNGSFSAFSSLPSTQNMLNNGFPTPLTSQPVQFDFNTIFTDFFQTLTQDNLNHPINSINASPHLIAQSSTLKRSAPFPIPNSSSPSPPKSVNLGERSRQVHYQTAPTSEPTVASVYGLQRQGRYARKAEDFSHHLLAFNPAEKIGMTAITNFLGFPQPFERIMEGAKVPTAPIGRVTDQLQGLPDWTPETAQVYSQIVADYCTLRCNLEYSVKFYTPPVLTPEEQVKRRAEAVEYERNCALYKDSKQSVRSSLFNQYKPGFPQTVKKAADIWIIFKTNHTNSGIHYEEASKNWNEIKAEKGEEYWKWFKRASDLKDEHLRQREMRYIVLREKSGRKRKSTAASKVSGNIFG